MKTRGMSLVVVGCVSAVAMVATAQVQKGKTRLASTKQIMVGLVHPNHAEIEKLA